MLIGFTRNNEPTQVDGPSVIKSCFQFCTPDVKQRIQNWLEDNDRKAITLRFGNDKVRLVKYQ